MEITISWSTIVKMMIAGFGSYVLLPAALILRDWVLRRLLERYFLNEDLERKINEYAWKERMWDTKYSKSHGQRYSGDGAITYLVDGEEVDMNTWITFQTRQTELLRELRDLYSFINSRSSFVKWIFSHYRQNEENPIPEWVAQEQERLREKRSGGSNDAKPS